MNLKSLLPILAIIFVAGCVQQAQTVATPSGVIVTQFAPEVPEIFEGEDVMITAIIQNIGDSVASDVKATLFGIDPNSWGIANDVQSIGSLEPQEEYEIIWSATAPSISVPEFTFTPVVRVEYYYRTAASANIRFITDDYYNSLPLDERKTVQTGIMSTQVSKAPITVSFSTTKKLFKVSDSVSSLPVKVTIQNIGGGIPFYGDDEKVVRVQIDVNPGTVECGDKDYANGALETLIRGERKTIICYINPGSFTNLVDVVLNVNLDYQYYIDSSTSIKVIKPEESTITPTLPSQPTTTEGGSSTPSLPPSPPNDVISK